MGSNFDTATLELKLEAHELWRDRPSNHRPAGNYKILKEINKS
jgi:hypothetical protein